MITMHILSDKNKQYLANTNTSNLFTIILVISLEFIKICYLLLKMMSNELMAAIKRRKKKMGGGEDSQEQEKQTKAQPQSEIMPHSKDYDQNKARLEAFFAPKKEEVFVPVKQDVPQGDQKKFNSAKGLLQQHFGGGGGNNLPPPPPSGKLPPPPPSGLPLPPPPPPPANLSLPPPPPPPSGLIAPPPPPLHLNNPSTVTKNTMPPPPPPPAPYSKSSIPAQQKSTLPPPPIPSYTPPAVQKQPSLPPPPLPSPPSKVTTQPYSPPSNISHGSTLPPPPPPPPSQSHQSKPSRPRIGFDIKPQSPPPAQQNRPRAKQMQPEKCFVMSQGTKQSTTQGSSEIPKITAWTDKQLQKTKRKKIFSKNDNKRFPLTQEALGKNLGGLIKQQFIKTADINKVIGLQVHKNKYQFHFPTIEEGRRQIEPIQTLYADTNFLDLVSCFMNKNPHGEKPHKDQRDIFITSFQDYNWEKDPHNLKLIREAAQILPDSEYQEPNFISIKTATSRTLSLIQTLVQSHDYARCDQLQRLINQTEECLKTYSTNPQPAILQEIESYIVQMKKLTI